jgi:DNA-binding transcriptional LysR family regulator
MNLNLLLVFHMAAEEKSFTRAAKRLHLTQPGISKHIKDLEEYYGVRCFDRAGKKLILTQAGQVLFETTKNIFPLVDDIKKKIDDLGYLQTGCLAIGASITLGIYVLLPTIKKFRIQYPKIELVLDISSSRHICDKVLDYELDIGFLGAYVDNQKLSVKELMRDELVLVFPSNHPWAKKKVVDVHDLSVESFVWSRSGSGTRTILENRLRALGISLNAMEIGHTESVKKAVEAGLGVSILSKAVVERELDNGWLKTATLKGINLKRMFYYAYRKDRYLSNAAKTFLSLALQMLPARSERPVID